MNKAFRIDITSSSDKARHTVTVNSANGNGQMLIEGRKVIISLNVTPRHKAAAMNLIEMGACGGNFDF